jgi:hypothetical protein
MRRVDMQPGKGLFETRFSISTLRNQRAQGALEHSNVEAAVQIKPDDIDCRRIGSVSEGVRCDMHEKRSLARPMLAHDVDERRARKRRMEQRNPDR